MTDSIVVKRLVRNLRYRQTYVRVFEGFLEPDLHPVVLGLLTSLIESQQTEIASLSSYLERLGVDTREKGSYRKLMHQAAQRHGLGSRLRFIRYGLRKAVSWYTMQLTDKQMTADPKLHEILYEAGEIEAAKLWSVETVMAMLRIPPKPEPGDQREPRRLKPQVPQDRHPRQEENSGRPAWKGRQFSTLPHRYHRDDSDR
jgi:hypothetical protein